jgi:nitroreductase
MENVYEAITARKSCRSYVPKPLPKAAKTKLLEFLKDYNKGPFGNTVDFKLLELDSIDPKEARKLGTYGVIRGARSFLAPVVASGDRALADLGYCCESAILYATKIGLGTCWLGGTFNRSGFLGQVSPSDDELMPAVIAIGRPGEGRTIMDRIFRATARSATRKPWEWLFHQGVPGKPLTEKAAGPLQRPLEALRLAPSASNKQPWRVVKERKKDVFHFYIARTSSSIGLYNDLQSVDIGIGICHFDLVAKEAGLAGTWSVSDPGIKAGDWEYIASWKGP